MIPSARNLQDQRTTNSDDLWNVEWGSVRDLQSKSAWSNSNSYWKGYSQLPAQRPPQAVYCVPMGFMVTTQMGSANSALPVPCNLPILTPGSSHTVTDQRGGLKASRDTSASTSTCADVCPILVVYSSLEKDYQSTKHVGAETSEDDTEEALGARDYSESNLPSVGSVGHFDGTCKRCAFFPKGRCTNGADCTHCHFDHAPRARARRRGRKERIDAQVEEYSQQDDDAQMGEYSQQKDDVIEVESAVPSSSDCEDNMSPEKKHSSEPTRRNGFSSESSVAGSSDSEAATSQVSTEASSPRKIIQPYKRDSLKVSPKSWAAQQRTRRATVEGEDVISPDIGRKVRGLLNKLTEERFESLCGQILALRFSTSAELATIAEEIFDKATTQNGFRALYSELCLRIDAHLAAEASEIGGKAFRKSLANECQASFERHLQSTDVASYAHLDGDDRIEQEMKLKMHRIGNIRFIGELLIRRLLAPKLIAPIVNELLNGDELALESLIALLTILAPCFEQKVSLYQAPLKDAFATLSRKQSDKKLSLRIRCQLNDLFDARGRSWAARCTSP